ncbi:MAG: hypothetical protein P4L84_12060 [Isosphaeraceae bacterium]|nr:hypothetical protein [Isosphaeraceae bacterium]
MRRRALLRALTATPLAAWFRWSLPSDLVCLAEEVPNAATVYRRAFACVQALGPEDQERLAHAATLNPDDPSAVALIEHAKPALEAIREAVAIGRCDWQREVVTDTDLTTYRHGVSYLHVIRIAVLSARRHADQGRSRPALDDLFAALALAHRVGGRDVLFARVLETAGEVAVFQALGRILPKLDRPALEDLSRRLDGLAPPEPASAAIGPESRFIVGSIRAKLLAMGPVIAGGDWETLGFDAEEAATLKRLTGGDHAAVVAHLEKTGPAFEELGRRLDLPRPNCRTAFDEFMRTARRDQPVVASLAKNGWGARHVVDRMLALRAMLRAGLALVRDGEPAFRKVPDPFGAGPFGLERRGKGYVIRSALDEDGRPAVVLTIGEAA